VDGAGELWADDGGLGDDALQGDQAAQQGGGQVARGDAAGPEMTCKADVQAGARGQGFGVGRPGQLVQGFLKGGQAGARVGDGAGVQVGRVVG
jgi:hypothetical protein